MLKHANIIFIAIVSVSIGTLANAQTKKSNKSYPASSPISKKWNKEPETVFGIKLGGLVSDLSLPPCPPKNRPGFYDIKPTFLCILNSPYFPEKTADLYGTPELSVNYRASISYYKGFVEGILLSFKQSEFENMKTILVERYGEPTNVEIIEVTSGAGAKLTSQQIEWKGIRTNIMAIERVGDIHQSYVMFSDVDVLEKKLINQNSSTKKDAEKF